MSLTPIGAAKIANAKRAVTEILQGQMCPYAESAARQVIDELRRLGWTPPGWRDDEAIPQPSYSTPQGRERARQVFHDARKPAEIRNATEETP